MDKKYRILICEFHEESDTFNPIPMTMDGFAAKRFLEGPEAEAACRRLPCEFHGMIDAVEAAGGIVVPTISMYGSAGGRVSDAAYRFMRERVRAYIEKEAEFDGVFTALHGATCSESEEDVVGDLLEYLRSLIGEEKVIAASFDLHANITEKVLKNADVVCGFQSYPHVDFYETGYRAASLGMRLLAGEKIHQRAVQVPLIAPPSGYDSMTEPFKGLLEHGKQMVADGRLLDYSVFNVQPWLDIEKIASCVVTIGYEDAVAAACAEELAEEFFDQREALRPELMTVDAVIDCAEDPSVPKPVILVDSADSPNGGAVGDGVLPALRIQARGSDIRAGMFVKDDAAVDRAFAVGVGGTAVFEIGAKITPNVPGPFVAEGRVCSLHDGDFEQEGPAGKGFHCNIGRSAVIRFGRMDILVCEKPTASGDPQIFRNFGIEPILYDLIVVKANTSYKVPYSAFAGRICPADTPGAGAANLTEAFIWKKIPQNLYPFCREPAFKPCKAKRYRR